LPLLEKVEEGHKQGGNVQAAEEGETKTQPVPLVHQNFMPRS
jgi:hypothetical protein